jgi:predicted cobalt transporter CbtA
MTPSSFLIRGLLAGLLAGLVAFGVAYIVGEPQVDAAIAIEEAGSVGHHEHAPEPVDATAPSAEHEHAASAEELTTEVSRTTQSTWGLLTGTVGVGVALGGITSLAAAFALGRLRMSPAQSTAAVSAVGFVAISLVPFLKYPATPPAVGNPETIGQRTELYFAFLAISVAAAVAEIVLAGILLKGGKSAFQATVIPILGFVVITSVAAWLLPTVNEVDAFPADILWFFRRASLLTSAALWATIGVVLTGLIGRLYAHESAEQARRELAASL